VRLRASSEADQKYREGRIIQSNYKAGRASLGDGRTIEAVRGWGGLEHVVLQAEH
jgi:hypothetical protein